MEILREILVALHLIGMAIIVGGYFSLIRTPKVAPGMLHGSYLQLITGLLLLAIAELGDGEVNHMKMGIKLVIAILVTIFAFLGNKKQKAFAASTAGGAVGDGGVAARAAGDGGVAARAVGDGGVAARAAGDGGVAARAVGDGGVATKVKSPSATMAHLVFAGAIINVLVAVFVH